MVRNLNIDRSRIGPLEADALFVIDADAVLISRNCPRTRVTTSTWARLIPVQVE
jgi:hypothetical protein